MKKKIKRANGKGSITKLKKNLSKPFLVRITLNGKRKVLGYYTTEREANKALKEYNINPFDLDGETMNFKELFELFLKNKKTEVEESSFKRYHSFFKNHFTKIEYLFIKDLKTPILQEIINNPKISTGTKKELKSCLKNILNYAVEMEYINTNRANFLKIPRHIPVKEKNKFTIEEIKKLWEHQELLGSKIALIMIYTGMRIGEVTKIKKENVDLINCVISNFGNKTLKSKKRFIPIHKDIFNLIKDLYEKTHNEYLISIERPQTAHIKENKMANNTASNKFNQVMELLGMNHTSHDARGTFASILNKKGINETIITDLMGHSDFKTTKEYYIENDEETIKNTIEDLDILN